jgi:hypothetical protein
MITARERKNKSEYMCREFELITRDDSALLTARDGGNANFAGAKICPGPHP